MCGLEDCYIGVCPVLELERNTRNGFPVSTTALKVQAYRRILEGAEEDIGPKKDEVGNYYVTRSFMVCISHQILFG